MHAILNLVPVKTDANQDIMDPNVITLVKRVCTESIVRKRVATVQSHTVIQKMADVLMGANQILQGILVTTV